MYKRPFLSKALIAYYCFLMFRCTGEYISLDMFYFVNITNSCSVIPVGAVVKARCRQAREDIVIVGSAVSSSSSSNLVVLRPVSHDGYNYQGECAVRAGL